MIGVGVDSGWVTHWKIASGVGEPIKARYLGVLALPVTIATLGIAMCEGVGE